MMQMSNQSLSPSAYPPARDHVKILEQREFTMLPEGHTTRFREKEDLVSKAERIIEKNKQK